MEKSYKNYPSRFENDKKENRDYYQSDNESFESDLFDIYNPGNSISTLNSSVISELNNKQDKSNTFFGKSFKFDSSHFYNA